MEISEHLKDKTVSENQSVTFICQLSKVGQKVTWFKAGDKISGRDYNINSNENAYSLTIPKACIDDSAEYTIRIGHLESSAKLLVLGKEMFRISLHFLLFA